MTMTLVAALTASHSRDMKLATQFNISLAEAEDVYDFAVCGAHIEDELFTVLEDYYTQNSQMPYEVAAHGDPYEWIEETIRKELGEE